VLNKRPPLMITYRKPVDPGTIWRGFSTGTLLPWGGAGVIGSPGSGMGRFGEQHGRLWGIQFSGCYGSRAAGSLFDSLAGEPLASVYTCPAVRRIPNAQPFPHLRHAHSP